ncbi:PglL family O-oligosaccharyltransferase [Gibbsiella dentisursi]
MVTGLLCLWLCILMHISFFNVGSNDGVYLPQNMLAWCVATVVIALVAGLMPCRQFHMTTTSWLLVMGVVLLTLPVLWSPEYDWRWLAMPRLVGLWGGVAFYIALLQCDFSERQKNTLLWSLTLAALWEAGNVWAGLFFPSLLSETAQRFIAVHGRMALGTFQQVNVTASFLATGFAFFIALFATRTVIPLKPHGRYESWLKGGYLLVGLFFIPGTLILMKSRIGWLGGMIVYLVAVVLTLTRMQRLSGIQWRQVLMLIFVPLAGVGAGIYLLDCSVMRAAAHSGSNYQRWLTLKTTWEMIRLHPWQGWGLGSFRMQFQHYMASRSSPNLSLELMGHPHNEVFYTWVEGGVIALAGIVILAWAGIRLLILNRTYSRLMTGVALVPIALHTQVEFPLYYSVAHVLTLLLIMRNLDVQVCSLRTQRGTSAKRDVAFNGARIAVVAGCIWGLFTLFGSLRASFILSHYEDQTLPDIGVIKHLNVSWLLHSRYEYDLLTEGMLEYSVRGDKGLLVGFLRDNAQWLATHTEPDSYANQIDVLHYLLRNEEACTYSIEANKLFPWDKRFSRKCLLSGIK